MGILDNPSIQKIEIRECGESMETLDPTEFVLEPAYFNMGYSKVREMQLRSGVLEKLRRAEKILQSTPGCESWRFKIWDGFRTLATQELLYIDYRNRLKFKHPDWNEDQLKAATQIFVSYPSHDKALPAPHNTGGAIDLTIIDENGAELAMGSGFDQFDESSFTHHYAHSKDEAERKFHENRILFKRVMEEVGFVNYHEEWWHFSYGDQAWAAEKGVEAIYGSMEL